MKPKLKKWLVRSLVTLLGLVVLIWSAFKLSPWPSALIIRHAFDKGGEEANAALARYVPATIKSFTGIRYDAADDNALLDIHLPVADKTIVKLPVIVWIHGGGLISGSKNQVANYCRILAGQGFAVAAIDYTVGPEAKYPTPLLQTQQALRYLLNNGGMYGLDTSKFALAGDSGGSMIAAQVANTICSPAYSRLTKVKPQLKPVQLKGLVLFCGIYDVGKLKTEGAFGGFMKTVVWSYFGKKDISGDPYANTASVINYLDNNFPASFISAGNNDPLLPQSLALSEALHTKSIALDTLFFPEDHKPGLQHEYQFHLDTRDGKLAFDRSVAFLHRILK